LSIGEKSSKLGISLDLVVTEFSILVYYLAVSDPQKIDVEGIRRIDKEDDC